MNIEDQWKNMQGSDDDLSNLLEKRAIVKWSSKDPLQRIKRNLLLNTVWGSLIAVGYIILMLKFPFWPLIVCIGITFLFTVWASVRGFILFRDIKVSTNRNSVLEEMERHYKLLKRWLNLQQMAGLLIYPVSAAGGFMLGGFLGAGKPIEEIMHKPVMIIALILAILVLVPLCFLLARWMNKKAFGQYTEQLKQNIEALRSQ